MTSDTPRTAEDLLVAEGLFAGIGGLRGLLNAKEFWAQQPYGTRFYYGDGYLHRSALECAIQALDKAATRIPQLERDLAAANAEREELRSFIKRQQIYTGNGGWTTLRDIDIDAAIAAKERGASASKEGFAYRRKP